MAKTYIHEATADHPGIVLDQRSGIFEITGASFPEDAREFYKPVMDWIDDFEKDPSSELLLTFKLTYYNTSSSKVIQSILEKFEEINDRGISIRIKWYYETEDEDMFEAGLGYKERVEMPFEVIEITS